MRKVFANIDGPTGGPDVHTGPVGKLLLTCTNLPAANFLKIDIDTGYMSDLVGNTDLSSDQKYLRDIVIAISSGVVN